MRCSWPSSQRSVHTTVGLNASLALPTNGQCVAVPQWHCGSQDGVQLSGIPSTSFACMPGERTLGCPARLAVEMCRKGSLQPARFKKAGSRDVEPLRTDEHAVCSWSMTPDTGREHLSSALLEVAGQGSISARRVPTRVALPEWLQSKCLTACVR